MLKNTSYGTDVTAGQKEKLHLGCGLNTPEGWINVDGSWNAWLAKHPNLKRLLKIIRLLPRSALEIPWKPNIRTHDVRRTLPFSNDSLSVVYASHLLEHLYLEEAKRLLGECFRVLKPGGILRTVVPDLKSLVEEYVSESHSGHSDRPNGESSPADRLNKKLGFRKPEPPSGNLIYRIYSVWKDLHEHKWMYDAESLVGYFNAAGFREVREMQCHQSRIASIREVEEPERILNGAGICIEGVKP